MRVRKLLIAVVAVAVVSGVFLAGREVGKKGTPNPPTAPGATLSYSLEDIYNRLYSGADGAQDTFKEPTVAAGAGTMYTLDAIMGEAPVKDNTNGATKADVLAGKEFWGLNVNAGQWGQQTGEAEPCVECSSPGTMVGTRWCNNGDGTVTDMTTGLVWLRKADWGGTKPWRRLVDTEYCASGQNYICYDDVHARAGILKEGASGAGLSDGSEGDEWRLPTLDELFGLTQGDDPVSSTNPQAFTGVQVARYWSSTTDSAGGSFIAYAYCVDLSTGVPTWEHKSTDYNVWPVRGP